MFYVQIIIVIFEFEQLAISWELNKLFNTQLIIVKVQTV